MPSLNLHIVGLYIPVLAFGQISGGEWVFPEPGFSKVPLMVM
jgi:hypothetical protein